MFYVKENCLKLSNLATNVSLQQHLNVQIVIVNRKYAYYYAFNFLIVNFTAFIVIQLSVPTNSWVRRTDRTIEIGYIWYNNTGREVWNVIIYENKEYWMQSTLFSSRWREFSRLRRFTAAGIWTRLQSVITNAARTLSVPLNASSGMPTYIHIDDITELLAVLCRQIGQHPFPFADRISLKSSGTVCLRHIENDNTLASFSNKSREERFTHFN